MMDVLVLAGSSEEVLDGSVACTHIHHMRAASAKNRSGKAHREKENR